MSTKYAVLDMSSAKGKKKGKVELRKVVDVVHSSAKLSLQGKKCFDIFLLTFLKELKAGKADQDIISISFQDFCEKIGFNSNNTKHLKETFTELMSGKNVMWDILSEGKTDWGMVNLVSEIRMRDGHIYFSFPPTMREMLSDEKKSFAIIDMEIAKHIHSNYAYTLYQQCSRFKNVGSTGTIPLETWKLILSCHDIATFKEFRRFKEKVFEPSIREINEKTDLFVEAEYKKMGTSVVAIKVLIKQKNSLVLPNIENQESKNLINRLKEIGFPEEKAVEIIEIYEQDPEYLIGNLEVIEKGYAAGKVRNPSAYLAKALKEDFRVEKTGKEKDLIRKAEIEEKTKEEKAVSTKNQKLREEAGKTFFEMMTDSDKERLMGEFKKELEENNQLLYKKYLENPESPLVKKHFSSWVANKVNI